MRWDFVLFCIKKANLKGYYYTVEEEKLQDFFMFFRVLEAYTADRNVQCIQSC